MLYQNGSLSGGPLGKRARFLPMLDINSPKKEPPLKMGTPRLVGKVHLDSKGEKLASREERLSNCLCCRDSRALQCPSSPKESKHKDERVCSDPV